MINKVFSFRDLKAEAYMPPFCMQQKGQAIRAFTMQVNGKEGGMMAKFPADFTLYQLGEFDDTTGRFKNAQDPIQMGNGIEFLSKE